MAYCTNCGKQLIEGSKFCSECGTAVGSVKTIETQRKMVFDGELHKCPQCGETLNAFATNCPSCGYELRGIRQSGCVNDLAQRLSESTSTKQKHELISNFYIPNTREDIYEFFILAYSNISAGDEAIDAWLAKLEQAYFKAKLAFGDSQEYDQITLSYNKIRKEYAHNKLARTTISNKSIRAIGIIVLGLIMIAIGEEIGIGYFAGILVFGGMPVALLGLILLIIAWIRKKK